MENTPLIVALVSTIGFVLYSLVAGIFSDFGHHGASSHGHIEGDGWAALEFISIQAILLALMSYSWSWLFWETHVDGMTLQVLATFLSGSAMVALYVIGMRMIKRLNTEESPQEFIPTVGMPAVAYLNIPAAGDGMGQVTILDIKKGSLQINATSEGDQLIETGCPVVVTAVHAGSVTVRKA